MLLEGEVAFGAVNCESAEARRLCNYFQIQSYPTILFFHRDNQFDIYTGQHTSEDLYSWAKLLSENHVVAVTPAMFDEVVVRGDASWIVDFSAGSWCGPCTMLKPKLRTVSTILKRTVRVGIVDCDVYGEFCAELGVEFYPQLRVFGGRRSVDEHGEDVARLGTAIEYGDDHTTPAVSALNIMAAVLSTVLPETLQPTDELAADDDTRTTDHNAYATDDDEMPVNDELWSIIFPSK